MKIILTVLAFAGASGVFASCSVASEIGARIDTRISGNRTGQRITSDRLAMKPMDERAQDETLEITRPIRISTPDVAPTHRIAPVVSREQKTQRVIASQ